LRGCIFAAHRKDETSVSGYAMKVEKDVTVVMRDGVRI